MGSSSFTLWLKNSANGEKFDIFMTAQPKVESTEKGQHLSSYTFVMKVVTTQAITLRSRKVEAE